MLRKDKINSKHSSDDNQIDEDGQTEAYYAVTISSKAPKLTINWLIDLLKSKGSSFQVKLISSQEIQDIAVEETPDLVLLLKLSPENIFNAAVKAELRKLNEGDSVAQIVKIDDKHRIKLTNSEKQRILLNEIEGLRFTERGVLFGLNHVKIYPGQSICM